MAEYLKSQEDPRLHDEEYRTVMAIKDNIPQNLIDFLKKDHPTLKQEGDEYEIREIAFQPFMDLFSYEIHGSKYIVLAMDVGGEDIYLLWHLKKKRVCYYESLLKRYGEFTNYANFIRRPFYYVNAVKTGEFEITEYERIRHMGGITVELKDQELLDIFMGDIKKVEQHIQNGFQVNKKVKITEDVFYQPTLPIMLAVLAENKSMIELLLSQGSKLDDGKEHAFIYACKSMEEEFIYIRCLRNLGFLCGILVVVLYTLKYIVQQIRKILVLIINVKKHRRWWIIF